MWLDEKPASGETPKCSFCGQREDQVDRLTAGPGQVYICNDCVDLYREHIEKSQKPITKEKWFQICPACGTYAPPSHRYCFNCGTQYPQQDQRPLP